MKKIEVVAAIIRKEGRIFATLRGVANDKAAGKREQSQTCLSSAEWEQARLEGKAGWEFPGGKMEVGESPEEALKREIREELSADISVDKFLCTVEYDYPKFGLKMHCYICSLQTGALHLNEHEAARWLTKDNLDSVKWLPADEIVIEDVRRKMYDGRCMTEDV